MPYPVIPTGGRVVTATTTGTTSPRTFPSLTGLTKNAGDTLIAIVVCYQTTAAAGSIFGSWGASFTEIGDFGGSTNGCIGVAYKISDGTETGTFTVTQAATITGQAAFILLSIPGGHPTTPPEAGSSAQGTPPDPASFNPSGWDLEDTLWIAVALCGETALTGSFTGIASAPTNFTDYAQTGISADAVGGVEGAVAFRQQGVTSQDVGTFSMDTSNARGTACVIAVRPAFRADPLQVYQETAGKRASLW